MWRTCDRWREQLDSRLPSSFQGKAWSETEWSLTPNQGAEEKRHGTHAVAFGALKRSLRQSQALLPNVRADGPWIRLLPTLSRPFFEEEEAATAFRSGLDLGYFSQLTSFKNVRYREEILDWYQKYLESEGCDLEYYLSIVSESWLLVPRPKKKTEPDGSGLGIELLRFFSYAHKLEQNNMLLGYDFILEVGTGYGGFARVLKSFNPRSTYILVDVDESLVYSLYFLSVHNPNAKIALIEDSNSHLVTTAWLRSYDFVFCPPRLLHALKHVVEGKSLFVNIFSFGEMNNTAVQDYLSLAQGQNNFTNLFLLNLVFQKASVDNLSELDQGEWATALSASWDIRDLELNPALLACPQITSLPSSLMVIAERNSGEPRSAEQLNQMLSSVLLSDWVHFSRVLSEPLCEVETNAGGISLAPPAGFYEFIQCETYAPSADESYVFDFDAYSKIYGAGTLRLRTALSGSDLTFRDLFELNLYCPTKLTVALMRLYLRICVIGFPIDNTKILKEDYYYASLLGGDFMNNPDIFSQFPYGLFARYLPNRARTISRIRLRKDTAMNILSRVRDRLGRIFRRIFATGTKQISG